MLDHRLALYDEQQRMVFGVNTYREFSRMVALSAEESEVHDRITGCDTLEELRRRSSL